MIVGVVVYVGLLVIGVDYPLTLAVLAGLGERPASSGTVGPDPGGGTMPDLWYKNAIIYSLDVDTFMDGNGDGVGDFRGLTSRLDYLAGLGVTCIWLLPFFPSPGRDNGYDVEDYYGVDQHLGTLGDFVEFTREARERGTRVIIDGSRI